MLQNSTVQEVGDGDLAEAIRSSRELVLVDFWAPWCGPCRRLAPLLEEVGQAFRGKVKVLKVNVDENQEWAQKLGVASIPALMFFRQGRLVDRIDGLPAPQLLGQRLRALVG